MAAWCRACRLLCLPHHHTAEGQQGKRCCFYPHHKQAEAAAAAPPPWPGPHCYRPNTSAATHSWRQRGPEARLGTRQRNAASWGRSRGTATPLRRQGLEGHGELWDTRPCSAYLQQDPRPQTPPGRPAAEPAGRAPGATQTRVNPAFSRQPAGRTTAPQPINRPSRPDRQEVRE